MPLPCVPHGRIGIAPYGNVSAHPTFPGRRILLNKVMPMAKEKFPPEYKAESERGVFNPELNTKAGKRLRQKAAEAVREHDRNKNDNTGRVHHNGPGK